MKMYFQLLFAIANMLYYTGSAFTIDGQFINVAQCYYPRVYLAVIDDIEGFHAVSSNALICSAPVDVEGNFHLADSTGSRMEH